MNYIGLQGRVFRVLLISETVYYYSPPFSSCSTLN